MMKIWSKLDYTIYPHVMWLKSAYQIIADKSSFGTEQKHVYMMWHDFNT